jgi:hypothetical protein
MHLPKENDRDNGTHKIVPNYRYGPSHLAERHHMTWILMRKGPFRYSKTLAERTLLPGFVLGA